MNFQTMNKQRKFILIAAGIGIIAMFLPWIKVSFMGFTAGSVNGMHDWGILVFLCFIAAGGVTLLGDQTKTLDKTMWMVALVAGGIAALITILFFLKASDAISYISFGFYLALIASLGVLYSAYAFRAAGYNIKDGFNSLKEDIEKKTKTDTPPSSE
jgi:peptidoglycan/LPS O-acetylase OafA/YrhL